MAGLQYYFFPTDFLYPRPVAPSSAVTTDINPTNNNINPSRFLPLQATQQPQGDSVASERNVFRTTTAALRDRSSTSAADELALSALPSWAPVLLAPGLHTHGGLPETDEDAAETVVLAPLRISTPIHEESLLASPIFDKSDYMAGAENPTLM